MEIGFNPPTNPRRVGTGANARLEEAREVIKLQSELVEMADSLGFTRVGFTEHHFVKGMVSTAPLVSAAVAAARTKNLRVSTDVILTPYHQPMVLAEQIGLTDILTDGRLDTGFGRGSSPYEAARVGIKSILEAGERQMECLEILLGVWSTEEEFTYEGRYYTIPPVTALPRPIQKPHPPMWVAARSADTLRFCVEKGLGIHTTAILEPMSNVYDQLKLLDAIVAEVGAPGRPRLGANRGMFISEDPKEIREWLERTVAEQVRMGGFSDSTSREQAQKKSASRQGGVEEGTNESTPDALTPESLAERLIVGTPDVVVRRLREYEALGFDEYAVQLPGSTHEQAVRALKLLGEFVIPEFRDRPIAPKVRSTTYAPLAVRSGRDEALEAEIARAYDLGLAWRDWVTDDWVAHVDRVTAAGESRPVYVFDFAVAPKVKGDVTGFIDPAGKLQRIVGEVCPVCERPVIAIFNRRHGEAQAVLREEIRRAMREGHWHDGGRPHVATSPVAVGI